MRISISYALAYFLSICIVTVGCGESSSPEPGADSVSLGELEQGPIQHEVLPEELVVRIKNVHAAFADVDTLPLESWIDNFRRDANPENEVIVWEAMQVAYETFCDGRELTTETKEEVYEVVLMRSLIPEAEVLAGLELQRLSIDDAKAIMYAYSTEAKPITVIRANP